MYYLIWYCIISYYIDHIIFYNKSYDTISYYMIKYNIIELILYSIMIHDNIYHLHPPSKFEWNRTSFYEDPWRWRSDSVFWTSFMFQIQSWMYHESKGNFFFQIKPVFSKSKHLVVSCSSTNKNEIMLCFWSYFYLHDAISIYTTIDILTV